MPPEAQSTDATGTVASPATDPVGVAIASLAAQVPPADVVRQSPEYQEVQRQLRETARREGSARVEAEQLRAQLAASQQAAEAQRAQTVQHQLQAVLGVNAPAFAEVTELMRSDPIAAAQRFADLMSAQSGITAGQPAAPTPSQGVTVQQPMQLVPPANPGVGLSASAPLGAPPAQTTEAQAAEYLARFEETVKANRDPRTRTRVRARERAAALGNYLKGQYLARYGIDPDLVFSRDR